MNEPVTKQYRLEEVSEVAQWLLHALGNDKVILLKGELGAGKTTLIKEFVKLLGVNEAVTSPTYTIVNEYVRYNGNIMYHMDLYRLKSIEEAIEIGVDEMLDSGRYCIIEWPEIIEEILIDGYLMVEIDHLNEQSRIIRLSSN